MKAVVFIAEFADGTLEAVADNTAAKVKELAVAARASGTFRGQPITKGLVLSTQQIGPVMQFRCRPEVKTELKPAKKKS